MKKNTSLAILILLFVVNVSALATLSYNRWIRERESDIGQEFEVAAQILENPLDLTSVQVDRMKDIRLTFENDAAELRKQIYDLRMELMVETRKPEPDLARIDEFIEKISLLQSHLQKKVIRNMLKDGEVLNHAQRNSYFSMFEENVRSWGPGRGQQRGGRRGPRWQRNR